MSADRISKSTAETIERSEINPTPSVLRDMSSPFVVVAALWVVPGRHEDFARFETSALSIMARHGGSLSRRLAIGDRTGADAPSELHLVTFPNREAYEAYRSDPELAALAELRSRAIVRTVIWEGVELPPFIADA